MWLLVFVARVLARPDATLQFSTYMRVGEGYGHDGDGCIAAYEMLETAPVISKVWFDAKNKRLAQSNTGLAKVDPTPNTTHLALFEEDPPTEVDLTEARDAPGGFACTSEPLPPSICANGSRVCPPRFGNWGDFDSMFTGILGMFYENTTLLKKNQQNETWQWSSVELTPMPNGTRLNVTRNYTYILSATAQPDKTKPILRFQWTQSIPLRPAIPIHRDCFVFDYSLNYIPGPSKPSRWEVPSGVKCFNRTQGLDSFDIADRLHNK
eukprot:jgi/Bigna1/80828/fgenesh1_pg.74_\